MLDMRPRGVGGSSGGGAPFDATYITQTPNVTLTNEQALSLLATGMLKNTTATGILSIGVPTVDFASAAQGALADTSLQPGDIGVTVQAYDLTLDALAAYNTNGLLTQTAVDTFAGRSIAVGAGGFLSVADGNGVAGNPTLDLADAELLALAGLTSAADKLPYFTGLGTAALTDFTAFARTILDDANQGAVQTTLGLVIGTNVQAWDADLDTLASLAKTDGNFIVGDGAAWVVESGATVRTSLGLGTLAVINDAPSDGSTYGRNNAAWAVVSTGSTLPVADTQTIVKGSVDATKLLRFEIDGFTAGATRVLTPPNQDTLLAGQDFLNVFTVAQTINPGSDTTELTLKAFATKTTPFVLLRNSANTELVRIDANTEFDVFIGKETGQNVSGDRNTLVGYNSGKLMTTPQRNTALGYNTLGSEGITTGGSNSAFGSDVLSKLTSGTFNVGFGASTLYECTIGDSNMAIGRHALRFLVSGSFNVAIGQQAGEQTTVSNSVYIGYKSGMNNASGGSNTLVGYQTGLNMGNAQFCVFIGANAGANETTDNKLYIHNTNSATPLIYGDFNNGLLRFHSTVNSDAVIDTVSLVRRRSSGTPGTGLGSGLRFGLHSSTTENQDAGRLSCEWATATHASRKARSIWLVYDTAAREGIRIEASGSAPMLGFLGAAAIARPTTYTLASTATRTMPTPEATFTGQDNAQAGSVYAKSADLITLQTRLDSVEGVLRQLIIDLASTSGYGLLVAS